MDGSHTFFSSQPQFCPYARGPPHSHGDTLVHMAMPPPNSHHEGHASCLGKHTESAKQDGVQERGGCRPQRCSGQLGKELRVPRHLRHGVECGMDPGGHGGTV